LPKQSTIQNHSVTGGGWSPSLRSHAMWSITVNSATAITEATQQWSEGMGSGGCRCSELRTDRCPN